MDPTGWKAIALRDCGKWYSGGTPSMSHTEYWGGEIPWISAKSMNSIWISDSDERVTQLGAANGTRIVPANTIFILVRGSGLFKRIPVGISTREMTFNQDLKAVVPYDFVKPEFLLYWLLAKEQVLLEMVEFTGIGAGRLATELLMNMEVRLPSLEEQERVIRLPFAIDDELRLLKRMSHCVERFAGSLFKSWFVDFDPVRAKVEGKKPFGMDDETAALFPDSFEDSELGKIPKGWRKGVLQDIAEITMGQSPPGDTYNDAGNGLLFYQGVADFGERFPSRRIYCSAPTRFAEPGDILLSVRAPIGRLNVAFERCSIGRGNAAIHPKGEYESFIFYQMKQTQSQWSEFEAGGTVFGCANRDDVHSFRILLPPVELMQAFSRIIAPFDHLYRNRHIESQTLANLRDTLLPKLLSGEIRIPADKVQKIGSGKVGAQ
jgi:type I restriction enzyme S subunit